MGSRNRKGDDELQSMIKTLVTKMCSSEDYIKQLSDGIIEVISEKFEKRISLLEEENVKIKRQLKTLQENNNILVNKQERFEKHLRRKTLRFYGVEENNSESTTNVLLDILNIKMKSSVNQNEVESCFRIGKSENNKKRPILVKFKDVEVKNKVFGNKKFLKGSGIVSKEDLTVEQFKLYKGASEKVGINGKVWTYHGNIFAKYLDQDLIIKINNGDDLNRL